MPIIKYLIDDHNELKTVLTSDSGFLTVELIDDCPRPLPLPLQLLLLNHASVLFYKNYCDSNN
jgi:hypothetical protein